jgi:hypothetical protein
VGVLAVSAAAASASTGPVPSQPLTGRVPGTPRINTPPAPVSFAGFRYRIVVIPELQAGEAGWQSFVSYTFHSPVFGSGGGGGYPTASWPFLGLGTFSAYVPGHAPKGDVVDYALTGPPVAAVRFAGRTVSTITSPDLPAGDRAAVFFVPASSPPVTPSPALRLPGKPPIRLFALDGQGRVIPSRLPQYPLIPSRFWQAPTAGPPGPSRYTGPDHQLAGACELSQHGLRGLTPEFGHVMGRLTLAQRIALAGAQGEVFLSCIDTEYYLHGWPLEVSVLVDASSPGRTLGVIPGARPLSVRPGTVNLPVELPGASLSARQVGQAWLVVQGGANLTQRLRVLQALRISRLALLTLPS